VSSVIEVERLSRRFGDFVAVRDVSFAVARGEIFGYLGANGAGKSTTIRMLTGLLRPSGGSARVAGHDIDSDAWGLKSSIGYMSQKFSLYLDLPVIENLRFFGGAYGLTGRELAVRVEEALALADLVGLENTPTGSLPGGIRQRLALSCSLLHRPEIVFLDEPTAGVDPAARRSFWRVIRELSGAGTTVFVTTHYLDEAEYCARIGLMVDGRLVALDTPQGLKAQYVPERVLVVHGEGLNAALPTLRHTPGVHSATPFGAGLHLRVDAVRCPIGAIERALRAAGASGVSVQVGEASLEDVFLEVVGATAHQAVTQ
jgi:ABC-2 type transport system ATP-binding protein